MTVTKKESASKPMTTLEQNATPMSKLQRIFLQSKASVAVRGIMALVKRFGTSSTRQKVWNSEYAQGKWDYTDKTGSETEVVDPVYAIVARYTGRGRVLDLGCGFGSAGFHIGDDYSEYVGVDVSDIAIRGAIEAAKKDASKAQKNAFFVGDIEKYIPQGAFEVILFCDSLYYFPSYQILKILARYVPFLTPKGVLIVRLCDGEKHKEVAGLLEKTHQIVERSTSVETSTLILVCAPHGKMAAKTAV